MLSVFSVIGFFIIEKKFWVPNQDHRWILHSLNNLKTRSQAHVLHYCHNTSKKLILNVYVTDGDYCKHSIETANLQVSGGFYNDATAVSISLGLILISCTATVLIHFRNWILETLPDCAILQILNLLFVLFVSCFVYMYDCVLCIFYFM